KGAIVLLICLGVSSPAMGASYSLQEAIKVGLKQNPSVHQSEERLREANDISHLAIAKSLPTASGVLSYDRTKDAANTSAPKFGGDPYNYYLAELTASQTLLRRGFIDALYAGGQEKSIRKMDLTISQRDLTFNIVEAFYKVLLHTREYETLKKAEE